MRNLSFFFHVFFLKNYVTDLLKMQRYLHYFHELNALMLKKIIYTANKVYAEERDF